VFSLSARVAFCVKNKIGGIEKYSFFLTKKKRKVFISNWRGQVTYQGTLLSIGGAKFELPLIM
jgi:hypothetical protein